MVTDAAIATAPHRLRWWVLLLAGWLGLVGLHVVAWLVLSVLNLSPVLDPETLEMVPALEPRTVKIAWVAIELAVAAVPLWCLMKGTFRMPGVTFSQGTPMAILYAIFLHLAVVVSAWGGMALITYGFLEGSIVLWT